MQTYNILTTLGIMACFQDTQVSWHQKGKPFWI